MQIKEKEKRAKKGQAAGTTESLERQGAVEPRIEQQGGMSRAGERGAEVEELSDVEVPLMWKRRRLMRAGDIVPARENVSANKIMPMRDVTEQREKKTTTGEGFVAPEGSRARERGEKR